MYLTLLDIYTSDLLSNMTRGAYYGTTYVSLFVSSLYSISKCANKTTAVKDVL